MDVDTPYSPPQEPGNDSKGMQAMVHEPRRVIGDRGAAWLTEGWDAFKAAPGQWIAFCVVGFLLLCLLNLVPGVNFINAFLQPIWIAGVMVACDAQRNGEAIKISHLFSAFGPKAGKLILCGVFTLVCTVVLAAAIFGSFMLDMAAAENPEQLIEANPIPFLIRMLIMLSAMLPVYMAYWFAPALIMFSDMGAAAALKQSFAGCLKNLWPFTIYGLCLLVIGFVFFILLGILSLLGKVGTLLALVVLTPASLVLVPVTYSSLYLSFRDIFVD